MVRKLGVAEVLGGVSWQCRLGYRSAPLLKWSRGTSAAENQGLAKYKGQSGGSCAQVQRGRAPIKWTTPDWPLPRS